MTVSQSMPPSQFGMQHAIPVSDDILTAIGATVVCHSFVEGVLGIGIIRLSGLSPDIGLTMVSTMSFRALTDAFHGLMMKHVAGHDQHKRRYLDIMKAIRGFEQFRNQVSHSLWQTNVSDPQQTIRVKARTTRQGFDEVMEIVTIEKISAEIVKAQTALTDLEILVAEILMPAAGES